MVGVESAVPPGPYHLYAYAQHRQHRAEDEDEGVQQAGEPRPAPQHQSATLEGGGGQMREEGAGKARPRTPLERRLERSSMARYGEKYVPSPRGASALHVPGVVSCNSLIGEAPTPCAAPHRARCRRARYSMLWRQGPVLATHGVTCGKACGWLRRRGVCRAADGEATATLLYGAAAHGKQAAAADTSDDEDEDDDDDDDARHAGGGDAEAEAGGSLGSLEGAAASLNENSWSSIGSSLHAEIQARPPGPHAASPPALPCFFTHVGASLPAPLWLVSPLSPPLAPLSFRLRHGWASRDKGSLG